MPAKTPRSTSRRDLDRRTKTPQSSSLASNQRRHEKTTNTLLHLREVTVIPATRGRRTSINIFDSDLDLLEPLRVYLRVQTGLRVIRDSTLLQVLCRGYTPGPQHVAALKTVEALDGRRQIINSGPPA